MIMSFIPEAFQSSSHRYRVKGAIATRCSNLVGPTERGWKRRDIVLGVLSVRDDVNCFVIWGFLRRSSIDVYIISLLVKTTGLSLPM